VTACPFRECNGQASLRYRLRRFDVLGCDACGILFRHPLPDDDEIRAMYDDPAYHASEYFAPLERRPSTGPEARIHEEALGWLDALCRSEPSRPRRLLDVGCGNGVFLARARARGWNVEGVELSHALSERCRCETGIEPRRGDYLDLAPAPAPYDAICMWDFLEHTRDPRAVLERAIHELNPTGTIIIFTIDVDSLFNLLGDFLYRASFGRLRQAAELLYDARHNYYFSRRTLAAVLTSVGLTVERTASYRAHLGRWLAEPAPAAIKLGGDIIDAASTVVGRRYRQLLICRRHAT